MPLLPWGPLPADLGWSQSNPRIADALARWVAIVERETGRPWQELVQERVFTPLGLGTARFGPPPGDAYTNFGLASATSEIWWLTNSACRTFTIRPWNP